MRLENQNSDPWQDQVLSGVRKSLPALLVVLTCVFFLMLGLGLRTRFNELVFASDLSTYSRLNPSFSRGVKRLVMAPFNVMQGVFLAPALETLDLDIKMKHMNIIYARREEALKAGQLLHQESDEYLPTTIRYKNTQIPVKLRLKGDWTDHLEGHKWSFRIRTKGDHQLFGMRHFSIQAPETRGFQSEPLFHHMARTEGILAPRYQFVNVRINGKPIGRMAVEEHFSKELLESQGRRESVIIRFNEDVMWEHLYRNKNYGVFANVRTATISPFQESSIDKSPSLSQDRQIAVSLLRAFIDGDLPASQVFDVELMGRFLALAELWDIQHVIAWSNMRFYYNPITARLEPIAYDANAHDASLSPRLLVPRIDVVKSILADAKVEQVYLASLHRLSGEVMGPSPRWKELKAMDRKMRLSLLAEYPLLTPYDFERVQKRAGALQSLTRENLAAYSQYSFPVTKKTDYPRLVQAYLIPEGKSSLLQVLNPLGEAVELVSVRYKNQKDSWEKLSLKQAPLRLEPTPLEQPLKRYNFPLPTDLKAGGGEVELTVRLAAGDTAQVVLAERYFQPARQNPLPPTHVDELLQAHGFLNWDAKAGRLSVRPGSWTVSKTLLLPDGIELLIPAGTRLSFNPKASLIVRGPLNIAGTAQHPVRMQGETAEAFWPGVVVLQANRPSRWAHVEIRNTAGHVLPHWTPTGSTLFYQSPFSMTDVRFVRNQSEDALNVVRSDFKLTRVRIEGTRSDALDSDFSRGEIDQSYFANIGGDAIDISGSHVNITNTTTAKIHDKAFSIGEKSTATARDVRIHQATTGCASKDGSSLTLTKAVLRDIGQVALMAYVKKPEYGGGQIISEHLDWDRKGREAVAQTGSSIRIDNRTITPEAVDIEQLYEQGYMKK